MIKRIIGILALVASLAVMVCVVLNRHRFSSMIELATPAVEVARTPAEPTLEVEPQAPTPETGEAEAPAAAETPQAVAEPEASEEPAEAAQND